MSNVGKILAHLHTSTQNLTNDILENVAEYVYCSRDGVDTVCLVTKELNTLKALVSNIPDEVSQASTIRYAVDLGSIGSDNVKLYVDSPAEGQVLLGFQCQNTGAIIQRKIYKKTQTGILLDKFAADGSVISENEVENICQSDGWTGDTQLLQNIVSLVEANNLKIVFLKRTMSNQSYIRVR